MESLEEEVDVSGIKLVVPSNFSIEDVEETELGVDEAVIVEVVLEVVEVIVVTVLELTFDSPEVKLLLIEDNPKPRKATGFLVGFGLGLDHELEDGLGLVTK